MSDMDFIEALEIVVNLAQENALESREVLQDPDVLQPIAAKQDAAIARVHSYLTARKIASGRKS